MDFSRLLYNISDDTAVITFNRPDLRNAFDQTAYAEVKRAVRMAETDDAVDFIVLRGAGSDFATGGDLRYIHQMVESGDQMRLYDFGDDLPFNAIRSTTKVTIAAVHGWCTAGGMCVAGACDIVVASRSAKFAILEGRVGIGDPFIPTLLKDRISTAKLSLLMYTGRSIDAMEAERLGLVSLCVEDDALDEALTELVHDLRSTSRGSRRVYKAHLSRLGQPLAADGPAITHIDEEMLNRLRCWSK